MGVPLQYAEHVVSFFARVIWSMDIDGYTYTMHVSFPPKRNDSEFIFLS
jgi:hypothetical protein